jgi:hypothetical protein
MTRLFRILVVAATVPLLTHCQLVPPRSDDVAPREASAAERDDVTKLIGSRFNQPPVSDMGFTAAGPFRFVNAPTFLYIDRVDVGSVAFEQARYGVANAAIDPASIEREALLARTQAALARTGLRAEGLRFDAFLDEFAGAAQPKALSIDFDPRKASVHVARTVAFRRELDGVPVFGSELVVGLMPDGSIGRFRMHWPQIDPRLVEEAIALQRSMRAQQWAMPEGLRGPNITVLEATAGIAHSSFADIGFEAQPVVRVLYRKTSDDKEYPLASTSYKYFDASGREVVFNRFPRLAGTPESEKRTTAPR